MVYFGTVKFYFRSGFPWIPPSQPSNLYKKRSSRAHATERTSNLEVTEIKCLNLAHIDGNATELPYKKCVYTEGAVN